MMRIEMQPVPLMTLSEVAAYLRKSKLTIRRWCQQGKLPFLLTPGGRYLFEPSAIRHDLALNAQFLEERHSTNDEEQADA
jgi:excisionase family DNA binding protein